MNWREAERMRGVERTMIRRIFDGAPADAINLGLGQPDLITPPTACDAARTAIEQGRTTYTSTGGLVELREKLALRYEHLASGAESVCVSVGSQQALYASCLTLAGPGDEILIPDPGYPAYAVVAQLIGATAVTYPLRAKNEFQLDPADLINRISDATRCVILCSPSNPTGRSLSSQVLRQLTEELSRRNVPWISDEIYSGLSYDHPFVSPSRFSRDGLIVSSVSKDLAMTGWRIGWVIGPPPIIARITAAQQYLVTCAPSISQYAVLATLGDEGAAERSEILGRFRARRELMTELLQPIPRLHWRPPDGAFYFFIDVSAYGDDVELARSFLDQKNVVTVPGTAFGEQGRGYLRMSFGVGREQLRIALGRFAEFLAEYGNNER